MTPEEALLRKQIFGIFSERDAQKRRVMIASAWAEDGVFIVVSQKSSAEGHAGIEKAAADFIGHFPDFTFSEHGDAQTYGGVGMMPWEFGPPGGKPVITGIDVLVMKGDKIGAIYVFDNLSKQ